MGCCLVVGGDVSSVSKMLASVGSSAFRGDDLALCATVCQHSVNPVVR